VKNLYLCFCLVLLGLFFSGCSKHEEYLDYTGPYLGQEPPGNEPQLFMPGLISTNYIDHCIAFLNGGKVCVFSIWEKGTFYMYEKDGRWTQPKKAPWQNEPGATTDFTSGPDDRTIYFQSRRPTSADDEIQEINIWTVEWTDEGWTEPVPLPEPANTKDYSEAYPSVDPDGSVYFFTRTRPDSRDGDIYRVRFIKGEGYVEAERFEDPINSEYYEVDPFVAPDGSYLLFGSDRPGGYGLFDLYTSFRRDDGTWTHPFNAGPTFNPFCMPTRTSVTPDGKYFFFPSHQHTTVPKGEEVKSSDVDRWGDYDVYWISTDFIDEIRERNLNKKCAAEKIRREYLNSGLSSAEALLEELYSREKNDYYFELSEFLVFCGELIAGNSFDQADKFYETLLSVFPEDSRIMLGYSVACILNGRTAYGLELMKIFWSQFPDRRSEDVFMITYQLRNKSKKEDELEVLKFFTRELPDSAYAFFNLAEAYGFYGDTEQAIENCKKALELKPDLEDAAVLLETLTPQGEYIGQKPPGKIPEIFAPGFISTEKAELNSVFTTNGREFYFSVYTEGQGCKMYFTKESESGWSVPEPVPFSSQSSDVDMCVTPDGTRMYFGSTRPVNGIEQDDYQIWYVDRQVEGWSKAKYLDAPINSGRRALYPSVSNSGTMYFQAVRENTFGSRDIYYSRQDESGFTEPIHLGREINSEYSEGDVFIAPDESYMIVNSSGRPDDLGNSDLYISFKKEDGSWTELKNMGSPINSPETDYCPMLSPDGKYFFFTSKRTGNGDIYWVDAKIIEDLRSKE